MTEEEKTNKTKYFNVPKNVVYVIAIVVGASLGSYFLYAESYSSGYKAGVQDTFDYNAATEKWKPVLFNGQPLVLTGIVSANGTEQVSFQIVTQLNKTQATVSQDTLKLFNSKPLVLPPQIATLSGFVDSAQVPPPYDTQIQPHVHWLLKVNNAQYILTEKNP